MEGKKKSSEQPRGEKTREPVDLPRELRPFMDEQDKLKQWPTKQKTQRMAVSYLATHFEPGRIYNEKQVNELLNEWHTFEDWALLRRVMFDWGYLDRESDGSRYWLREAPGQESGSELGSAGTSPA